ncbi:hypothetical protein F5Y16DRAFT_13678 [Xylariaceae sp. FL0255]|nr:hypothetical protein F5Y16DRAFT_13678 [Xylariaceae sp. FL0255]
MAPNSFRSKTGLGSRIRHFVNSHRRGTKSEQVKLKESLSVDRPATQQEESPVVLCRNSVLLDAPHVRSLCVRVTLNFCEPLNYSYSRDYEGSSSLQPTEALCEALLHRFDHCARELITRKDTAASDRTGSDGLAKPMRYAISVQILRNEFGVETETWASRDFRSFQRLPVGSEDAREIILTAHAMVGLFMRYHDEGFVWKDGPVRDDPSQDQETFPYRPGRVQPLSSIPRSYFLEKKQDFESTPGYTITLSFTSRNHHRNPPDWHDTLEVNSKQSSPLTLAAAESLFFEACYALDGVFRLERRNFEALHKHCTNSICNNCRHTEGDGIEITLLVKNNLGPQFTSLERTTKASTNLFMQTNGKDCAEFVERVKEALVQVRSDADEKISGINDFDFRITELRGRGWALNEPLVFTLDSRYSLSQRNVVAILDRLQTGVADILRGNAMAVRMTAHKRGHFILDKTLVAREPFEKARSRKKPSPAKAQVHVLTRLRQRIERDLEMICKDTFAITDRDNGAPTTLNAPQLSPEDTTPRTGVSLITPRELSRFNTPSENLSDDARSSPAYMLSSEKHEPEELFEVPKTFSPIPIRPKSAAAIRDPETGLRLFPLAPQVIRPRLASSVSMVKLRARRLARSLSDDKLRDNLAKDTASDPVHKLSIQSPERDSLTPGAYRQGQLLQNDSLVIFESTKSRHEASTNEDSSSERPHTPSLEFNDSPSVKSSIIVTPVSQGPLARGETDTLRRSVPNSDNMSDRKSDKVVKSLERSFIRRSVSSLRSQRQSAKKETSPAHEDSSATVNGRGETVSRNDDVTPNKAECSSTPDNSRNNGLESHNESCSTIKLVEEQTAEFITPAERGLHASGKEQGIPSPEIEDFSQSKPYFDFSSPPDVTSSEESEASPLLAKVELAPIDLPLSEENEAQDKADILVTPSNLQEAIPTDSNLLAKEEADQGLDVPPVLPRALSHPGLQTHRKSFGSSAYLVGLRERSFHGIDLRRALMGGVSTPPPSRPVSRNFEKDPGDGEVDSELGHPSTSS